MDPTHTTLAPDPRDIFLNAAGVIKRYTWKRSSGYERLKLPGFPRPLPGDVWRLDTLIAWEDRILAGLDFDPEDSALPKPPPTPPPSAPPKRNGVKKVKTEDEVI